MIQIIDDEITELLAVIEQRSIFTLKKENCNEEKRSYQMYLKFSKKIVIMKNKIVSNIPILTLK